MSQTFKEKLAELETKRRMAQDNLTISEAEEFATESDSYSNHQNESDVLEVETEPVGSGLKEGVQAVSKLKIQKTTLAILTSLFVIIFAQIYALGDFSQTKQVSQKSLDQKFTYKGGLKNGRFSGSAVITDVSGDTLKAQFKAGKLTGPLTYTKSNAYVVTENGQNVTIQLADQSVLQQVRGQYAYNGPIFSYQGTWRFAGSWQGKMQFANGAMYDGAWKNGLPDGKGTYLPVNGVAITGQFKMGELAQ